ncbi:hypothetical protein [Zhongshania arctica]|uniref:Uncharacterized protein n=1 Tax=Zhongshania arctica TaxID=3238302 RepID=A0ABV3TU36_9GAMM
MRIKERNKATKTIELIVSSASDSIGLDLTENVKGAKKTRKQTHGTAPYCCPPTLIQRDKSLKMTDLGKPFTPNFRLFSRFNYFAIGVTTYSHLKRISVNSKIFGRW